MADQPSRRADAQPSPLQSFMKWAGVIAAVLGLIAGVRQFLTMTADTAERDRRIGELLATGAAQQSARDYPQAWTTLSPARAWALGPKPAM